jgi:hypothetical protein
MTWRILVCCDGTPADRPLMALESCRAFLSLRLADADAMTAEVNAAGWRVREEDGAHLCPACLRAILAA